MKKDRKINQNRKLNLEKRTISILTPKNIAGILGGVKQTGDDVTNNTYSPLACQGQQGTVHSIGIDC